MVLGASGAKLHGVDVQRPAHHQNLLLRFELDVTVALLHQIGPSTTVESLNRLIWKWNCYAAVPFKGARHCASAGEMAA